MLLEQEPVSKVCGQVCDIFELSYSVSLLDQGSATVNAKKAVWSIFSQIKTLD